MGKIIFLLAAGFSRPAASQFQSSDRSQKLLFPLLAQTKHSGFAMVGIAVVILVILRLVFRSLVGTIGLVL